MVSKKWTNKEYELLKTCDGLSIREIQKLLPDKSRQSINYWCKKLNINVRKIKINSLNTSVIDNVSVKTSPPAYQLIRKYLIQYNILLDSQKLIDTFSEIEWYEFMLEGRIKRIPNDITSSKENWRKIMRHVAFVKCNMSSKSEILSIDKRFLEKYKLTTIKYTIDQKIYKILQFCFPEYDIKPWELPLTGRRYFEKDENIIEAIDYFLESNNLTLDDIMEMNGFIPLLSANGLSCLTNTRFNGVFDMLDWYFKKKNIEYLVHNHYYKPMNYWSDINNIKLQIEMYIDYLFKNNLVNNAKQDIPYYFSTNVISETKYSGIINAVQKYMGIGNVLVLIDEMYPEFDIDINEHLIIGIDNNSILNSLEEKKVFDYIYQTLGIKSIKAIGLRKSTNFTNHITKERYCPDFIIEGLLDKPIIIEYFGLYQPNNKNTLFVDYLNKTHRKNEFFNSLQSIYYIDLYPKDLKNECIGIKEKLKRLLNNT